MEQEHNNATTAKAILVVGAGGIGSAIIQNLHQKRPMQRIIIADKTQPDCYNPLTDTFIKVDLTMGEISSLFNLDIDTLIYCAGIGRLSTFDTFTDKEIDKNFAINTLPVLKLIRHYYTKINSMQDFYCAVITSITGYLASPLYSVYSASKAALVKFIEAVNAELQYNGVNNRITDVAPGKIKTAFHGEKLSEQDKAQLNYTVDQLTDCMYSRKQRYIPQEKEVYGNVLQRYYADPIKFASESVEYKLKNNKTNAKPQIKVGYLTGTFDLFHIGHLNLINNAKKYCDRLVVGVHPDGSHKGKEVFIPLSERMDILRNIKAVDEVIVCSSEDIDDYAKINYDYLFVGTDYKGSERFLRYEKYFANTGVQIIYLPYTQKTSSTQLRKVLNGKIQGEKQ